MRFVRVEGVIDPAPYLAELPGLEVALPQGAWRYISDPGHFDFYGSRCVKDLTLDEIVAADTGELAVSTRFRPNDSKHDAGLLLQYAGVTSVEVTAAAAKPLGLPRLGSVILDEVLPHALGCRHEIALTGGSIAIVCTDLTATWTPEVPR